MRILQVCHKPPRPAVDGGCIAMDNLTKGLFEEGHDVHVFCASTDKHPFRSNAIGETYKKVTEITSVYLDTRANFVDAFSNLVTRDSYNVSKYFSPDFDAQLERTLILKKYDVIQLESLFMTPYISTIRRFSKAKIVLRSHNLEYKIAHRSSKVSVSAPKKAYLRLLTKRLKEYEASIIKQVDGIATISSMDTDTYKSLGCHKPICTVPFGLDTKKYDFEPVFHFKPSLFHLGDMSWSPNAEGMSWFLNKVWPTMLEEFPRLKLHLAGKNTIDFPLSNKTRNLISEGEVLDAKRFMKNHGLMIVPLFSGSGIRVKIIEAMALGNIVISTPVGAEGLGLKDREEILIARNAREFIGALRWIHDRPEEAERLRRNARRTVEQRFDHRALTRRLIDFYLDLVPERPSLSTKRG